MIVENDVIYLQIGDAELEGCIDTAKRISQQIVDRQDLHKRDGLERFINVLMGEIAEIMVINWLHQNSKFAKSAVDKAAARPDSGHDIIVRRKNGTEASCSVKSSLSFKHNVGGILQNFRIATKQSEVRDINVQVYFWLTPNPPDGGNRITVPTLRQSAIIGWSSREDLSKDFKKYNHEEREAPELYLKEGRTMATLLSEII